MPAECEQHSVTCHISTDAKKAFLPQRLREWRVETDELSGWGPKPLLCLMGKNESEGQVNGWYRVGPVCHCLRGTSQASRQRSGQWPREGWEKHESLYLQTDYKRVQTSRIQGHALNE